MRRAFDTSLKKLRLDQVDLYLVHWPKPGMHLPSMFETLMKLKEEGRTRAIGVANFNIALLKTVVEEMKAPIACNQIEYHVMLDQSKVKKYLDAKSIPLVAYCPLAQGRAASDETLMAIGTQARRERRAGGAEMAARPGRRRRDPEGLARTRARRPISMRSTSKLDDDDRKTIAALPKDKRFVNPGFLAGVGLSSAGSAAQENGPSRGHSLCRPVGETE